MWQWWIRFLLTLQSCGGKHMYLTKNSLFLLMCCCDRSNVERWWGSHDLRWSGRCENRGIILVTMNCFLLNLQPRKSKMTRSNTKLIVSFAMPLLHSRGEKLWQWTFTWWICDIELGQRLKMDDVVDAATSTTHACYAMTDCVLISLYTYFEVPE